MSDWRDELLDQVRALVAQALPDVVRDPQMGTSRLNPDGVPVWEQGGILFTGERYKDKVKLTFAKGASLLRPRRPVQCQPRRGHAAGHRYIRRRQVAARSVHGSGAGGGRREREIAAGVSPFSLGAPDHPTCSLLRLTSISYTFSPSAFARAWVDSSLRVSALAMARSDKPLAGKRVKLLNLLLLPRLAVALEFFSHYFAVRNVLSS